MEHEDHPGLGDLPEEIRRLRNDPADRVVYPHGPPGVMQQIPGSRARHDVPMPPAMPNVRDVRAQNQGVRDAQGIPYGTPRVGYLVQTTFDARPINGNDWQFQGYFLLDMDGDPPNNPAPVDLTFKVPAGRIGIIRHFEWSPDTFIPPPAVGQPADQQEADENLRESAPFSVTLIVAGAVQTAYERIYQQAGERECYAIASENELIILRFQQNAANFTGNLVGYSPTISAVMHGNLLDSRGREKQYEPANQYRGDTLT